MKNRFKGFSVLEGDDALIIRMGDELFQKYKTLRDQLKEQRRHLIILNTMKKKAGSAELKSSISETKKGILQTLEDIKDLKVPFEVVVERTSPQLVAEHLNKGPISDNNGMLTHGDNLSFCFRGSFTISGELAPLYNNLVFVFSDFLQRSGFSPIIHNPIVKTESLVNSCHLPCFEEDLFKISDDMWLSPTSECQIANSFIGKSLTTPQFLMCTSDCFRNEIGGAGAKNKGLFRTFCFKKTELFIFCEPEKSGEFFYLLYNFIFKFYSHLGLSTRAVLLPHVEISTHAVEGCDIECLDPLSGEWIELASVSNCFHAQSSKTKTTINGKLAHTINGTGVAFGRMFSMLLSYYSISEIKQLISNIRAMPEWKWSSLEN